MAAKEKLRLDKYLWAIRLFKTRTLAATACDTGKVKFDGLQAKSSRSVSIGDEYEVKTEAKRWRIKVRPASKQGSLYRSHSTLHGYYSGRRDSTPSVPGRQLSYR
jgi:ribosomal 50S subunit-recycling heat shock protein